VPPQPNPSVRKSIESILKKHPDAGHRTLAKALHEKNPVLFTSVEQARDAVRAYTGNHGGTTRKKAENRGTARAPRKPGELPPLPKSGAKPWTPYVLNAQRVLVLSDIHLPHHCEESLELALEYGDKFQPDCVLINGDLFDFYQLSRFDKDPTKEKVSHELECGKQLFEHLAKRYPKAQIVYKMGNHDERWDSYLWKVAPILFDIDEFRTAWYGPAGITDNKVQLVTDQRIIMAGKLPILHGHELQRGANPVNAARGAYLRARDSVMVGHYHHTSNHTERTLLGSVVVTRSTGCLCDLNPAYARVNRWDNGFATVEIAKDGTYDVNLKQILKGKVH
jgi:predicted phosphodiesterase